MEENATVKKYLLLASWIFMAGLIPGVPSAQAKPDKALADFTALREDIRSEMMQKGKAASPSVLDALEDAIQILTEEQEAAQGRSRKLLGNSIKQLRLMHKRADFISPTNEQRINQFMAAAEQNLIRHLLKQNRSVT